MGFSPPQGVVPVSPPELLQKEWERTGERDLPHRPPHPHRSTPTPCPLGGDALNPTSGTGWGKGVGTAQLWESCHLNTGDFRSQGPPHVKDNDLRAFPALHESEAKYNFLMACPRIWKIRTRMSHIIKLEQRSVGWCKLTLGCNWESGMRKCLNQVIKNTVIISLDLGLERKLPYNFGINY